MRISSSLFFQTGLNSINAQQSDLMHLYQQIGSGQRMVTPADDPLAAAQAINISQSQSLNKRYADNREVAYRNLGTEENTLNSVTTLLQDVKTRLVEAGNGTLSDQDRATLANVLGSAKNNLLGLANATDGSGQYLFSGAQGDTPAFQLVGGKIVYAGDGFQRNIQADQTRQIPGSDVGSDVFNRAAPGTTGYLSSAAGTNGGTGVVAKPVITNPDGHGVGHTFTIEFTSATQYDVHVSDAAGKPIYTQAGGVYTPGTTKAISLPGGVGVEISGYPAATDRFTIEPITAPDYTAYADPPIAGVVIGAPRITDSAAVYPPTGFDVTFTSPTTYQVNPSGTTGTYDPTILNEIELAPGLTFQMSGVVAGTESIKVEASGAATNLNVFETLDSIIAALSTPNATDAVIANYQNALATAMQRIDVNYNNVLTVRASVGARMNELDAMNANGAARALSYSSQLSKLEDVDYYSATAQLQLRTSALEAAALAFRKIQATSLFNMGNN